MEEIEIKNKGAYLRENYPFAHAPLLNDVRTCLHCGKTFIVKTYKVFKNKRGDKFICCPNAPECDGLAIDWIDNYEF